MPNKCKSYFEENCAGASRKMNFKLSIINIIAYILFISLFICIEVFHRDVMKNPIHTFLLIILILAVIFIHTENAYPQTVESVYSMLFGWNTAGSIDILSRQASAFARLKGETGIAMSFGSFLAPERIVTYDEGEIYLNEARRAGLDYIIPSSAEFMFGVDRFREFAAAGYMPSFISANLIDERTREPLVDPYVVLTVSGTRICIIAMSDMNTLIDAPDENVRGVDVISHEEALENIYWDVISEYASVVIVAGRMDRDDIMNMALSHSFVDLFVTNDRAEGFSDDEIATTSIHIAGTPVYIGTESNDHLGYLHVKDVDGVETIEFSDITLGEQFDPDKLIAATLTEITARLERLEDEEAYIVKAGSEVADMLREVFEVDAVFLERQCMYYYPLEDSLNVLNVRKIVKPDKELVSYSLKGSQLKSILEQSQNNLDTDMRLFVSGVDDEMKVNSLPIIDESNYTVVTTEFLQSGGNGYDQFKSETDFTVTGVDMQKTAERYLVAEADRIRKLQRKKYWDLSLNLSLNTNFDRTDVDEDKELYGDRIPKPFRNMEDTYSGNFIINSQNNILRMNRTFKKHIFQNFLRFSYKRLGTKTDDSEKIRYNTQRNQDEVELSNKYTYNLDLFPAKPYVQIRTKTFLYSGKGKHPITGIVSAGGTRSFKRVQGLNVSLGISGTRDYFTLENTFGTSGAITYNRKFPAWLLFSSETEITSETNIYWNPLARFDMEFKMDSFSNIKVQVWKNIHADMTFKAYTYRNTVHRKVAVGFLYLFTLNYNINWNF